MEKETGFNIESTPGTRDATGPVVGGIRDGVLATVISMLSMSTLFDENTTNVLAQTPDANTVTLLPYVFGVLFALVTASRKGAQEYYAAKKREKGPKKPTLPVI